MNTPSYRSFSSVLARALLAYCVYEHKYEGGTATVVRITVRPRTCTVEDNGRGIGLHRQGYVTGLVEQLDVRGGAVAIHGIGLALIAMSSPSMTIRSRRDGRKFLQQFEWGVAVRAAAPEPWDGPSGTDITFTIADSAPEIDVAEVIAQAELWSAAHPGLRIDVVRGA